MLRRPEAVVSYQLGGNRLRLAGTGVGQIVLQRGWRWQGHLGPWSARRRASRTSEAFVLAGRLGARDAFVFRGRIDTVGTPFRRSWTQRNLIIWLRD